MRYATFANHVEARHTQLMEQPVLSMGAVAVHFAELYVAFGVVGYIDPDGEAPGWHFDAFSARTEYDDKDMAMRLGASFICAGPKGVDGGQPILLVGDPRWTDDYFIQPPIDASLGGQVHLTLYPQQFNSYIAQMDYLPPPDAMFYSPPIPPGLDGLS